ncbi:MAG TPA: FAD-dependent oxidoreductase [Marmoricola sp.]|nr:FAD-dependent oxidoreductase [Marmoricola sp.]
MTHVITRACCNDAACVPVCPVNCIHPTPDEPDYLTSEMLYIDPNSCVDCAACVDVCPVGAIVADYDVPDEFARFEEINARYFASPDRTDYPPEPQERPKRSFDGAPDEILRVAIVGSGPAASYAAEELLAHRGQAVAVDMFERLPVPWGLVRFGVAPDHQDTKAASTSFARTIRRTGLRLFLNTEVGKDISLDELKLRYHAVIYAVGATGDRAMGIPGEDLPGSHSATEFVAWYNGHPDYADATFDLGHERAVIIGNGNVALDVARILVSDPDRLARTDIAEHALAALRESKVREVVVVGRRGPLEAAFTTKELLGLVGIPGVDLVAAPEEIEISDDARGRVGNPQSSISLYKAALLQELSAPASTKDRRIVLRFLQSPVEVIGSNHVAGLSLARNELVADGNRMVAKATGDTENIECGLVFRSVGYLGRPVDDLPFDEGRGVIPHVKGRVMEGDTPLAGLYVTGWIKRGPSGVIGSNKRCARETVTALLDDFVGGRLSTPVASSAEVADMLPGAVGTDGWRRIDDHERSTGKAAGRPRLKLVDVTSMLQVAQDA